MGAASLLAKILRMNLENGKIHGQKQMISIIWRSIAIALNVVLGNENEGARGVKFNLKAHIVYSLFITIIPMICILLIIFLIILLSGCVSAGFHQRALSEARHEEQERCDRWLDKIANREITAADAKKLRDDAEFIAAAPSIVRQLIKERNAYREVCKGKYVKVRDMTEEEKKKFSDAYYEQGLSFTTFSETDWQKIDQQANRLAGEVK